MHVPSCCNEKSAYFIIEGWTLKSNVVGSPFTDKAIRINAIKMIIFIFLVTKRNIINFDY